MIQPIDEIAQSNKSEMNTLRSCVIEMKIQETPKIKNRIPKVKKQSPGKKKKNSPAKGVFNISVRSVERNMKPKIQISTGISVISLAPHTLKKVMESQEIRKRRLEKLRDISSRSS